MRRVGLYIQGDNFTKEAHERTDLSAAGVGAQMGPTAKRPGARMEIEVCDQRCLTSSPFQYRVRR